MTIQELVVKCKAIALDYLEMKSFYVGNEWDHSTSKGDTYPALWFEMPVLTEYQTTGNNKTMTFSLVFLTLPELDNTVDEINMISHMEELADEFLQHLKKDKQLALFQLPTSLSVKAINADVACGVRVDIRVNTGRVCVTPCVPPTVC